MDPADRAAVKEQLARHYELGESWVTKGRLRRADGEYRYAFLLLHCLIQY